MTTAVELPRIPHQVPTWHDAGAACRLFPELQNAWHDAKRRSPEKLATRIICAVCPVRKQCAQDALERGEPFGMWGGLDRQDRKALAIEFGFPLPSSPPPHGTNSRRVKWGCPCPECKDAHALYERERRGRARRRRLAARPDIPAASNDAVEPERPRVHLNLAGYHRRYRRRIGR